MLHRDVRCAAHCTLDCHSLSLNVLDLSDAQDPQDHQDLQGLLACHAKMRLLQGGYVASHFDRLVTVVQEAQRAAP